MGLTSKSIEVIGRHCTELEELLLDGLLTVSDSAVGFLARGCPALSFLRCVVLSLSLSLYLPPSLSLSYHTHSMFGFLFGAFP